MKKITDTKTQSVTFTFEDGLNPITIGLHALPEDLITQAALHGLSQKIGDSAAIPKTAENNYTVTEQMRYDNVLAMVTQLESGSWNAPTRAKSAPSAAALRAAIEVMVEMLGCTVAEATAMVTAKMNQA